jgi:hypothetical protein
MPLQGTWYSHAYFRVWHSSPILSRLTLCPLGYRACVEEQAYMQLQQTLRAHVLAQCYIPTRDLKKRSQMSRQNSLGPCVKQD